MILKLRYESDRSWLRTVFHLRLHVTEPLLHICLIRRK